MGKTPRMLRPYVCAAATTLLLLTSGHPFGGVGPASADDKTAREPRDGSSLRGHLNQARAKARPAVPNVRPAPLWQLVEPLLPESMAPDPDAPMVDVAGEAAMTPVGSGDLDPTIDVQITQEIIDKAAELSSAQAMYEFVRNEVAFQPYYGSRKGSVETLHQLAGNDYDQASLLIALLRASGTPARYAVGMGEMTVDQATDWLGVEDGTVAGSILFTNGMEAVTIVSGPDVVAVRCRRVWVEAFTPRPFGPPAWVPLDPAFALQLAAGGPDIPEEMGFDYAAFVQDYYDPAGGGVSLPRPETLVELFKQEVTDYLNTNHPGLTLDDVARETKAVPEQLGVLPASLPYTVRSRDTSFSEIPTDRRYQIRFHLYDGGTELIDHTVNLPEIAGRRLTISYVGATPADEAIIEANNGLLNTPPNQINIMPVLKVDGAEVASGAAGIGAGRLHNSDMHFLAPVNGQGLPQNVVPAIFNLITAGEYQAIGLSVHGVAEGLFLSTGPSDTEDFEAQLKHSTAMSYLERSHTDNVELGALMHTFVTGDVDDAILKDQLLVGHDGGGNPVSWEWRGLTVDADRSILGAWTVDEYQTGCGTEGADLLTLGGAQGSLNESLIFEDNFSHEAVSTIKILELAVDQGITVYHRWDSLPLPPNSLPSSVRTAIQNAIAAGRVVTFPDAQITYFNWTGSGYISMDPCTGAAGYIIAGGQSGGSTVDSWTDLIPKDPDKEVDCIEGEVLVPPSDSPDPSAVFCWNSATKLHFEYRVRIKYTDGSTGPWVNLSHDSLAPKDLAPGHYRLTVGNCGNNQRLITIVQIVVDSVTGGDSIGTNGAGQAVSATAQGAGDVTIKLKTIPADFALPANFVTWTGGTAGADQLTRTVSKGALIEAGEDVTATACGEEFKFKVYVFEAKPADALVNINITVTHDDAICVDPFGLTQRGDAWMPTETYRIYYENKKWKFVFQEVAYEIRWGVNSGGRTDVTDAAANPFPLGMGMPAGSTEAAKKTQAKADLTPGAASPHRSPRTRYWVRSLTEQHEQYHVSDWRDNYYTPKAREAETWVEMQEVGVTLANLDPPAVLTSKEPSFHTKLIDKTDEAQAAYNPGKEVRAYGDGQAAYQALADAIVP